MKKAIDNFIQNITTFILMALVILAAVIVFVLFIKLVAFLVIVSLILGIVWIATRGG